MTRASRCQASAVPAVRGPFSSPVLPPTRYPSSLLCNNNRQRTVADFHRSFEAERCAPGSPPPHLGLNGHETTVLSRNVPSIYNIWRNYVKGLPTRNPNY